MRWVEDGKRYRARVLLKEPRPYLKPVVESELMHLALANGYRAAWERAQRDVTATG